MRKSVLAVGLLVVGLLPLGCGSDNDNPAADKCNDLINSLCGRGADCIVQLGCDPGFTRVQDNQSCLSAAHQALACSNAKAVGSSYPACMSGIANIACSSFGTTAACSAPTLPAECGGVILF